MLIKVKVKAGAKKEDVFQKSEDGFDVRVKEKTERGQANRAVGRALAEYLKIPPSKIRIVKGARKPNKIFEIK